MDIFTDRAVAVGGHAAVGRHAEAGGVAGGRAPRARHEHVALELVASPPRGVLDVDLQPHRLLKLLRLRLGNIFWS